MSAWLNSKTRYGIIAQFFHWSVAALVFVQVGLGLYAAGLPLGIARLQWMSYHKSLGLTVLILVALRLAWRLRDASPPLPASMPRWEQRAAHLTHWFIYLVLFTAMLSGWLYASAAGLSINWFGYFLVPDLIHKNTAIAPLFKSLHHGLVFLLVILLVGHIGAAMRHAVMLKDGVMQRMLPGRMED